MKPMPTSHIHRPQRGAALIVTLIMLVIITLLGLASLRQTVLEERMSANLKDRAVALMTAEAGLRDSEVWLASQPEPIVTGLTDFGSADFASWEASDWASNGTKYGAETNATGMSNKPYYVAEFWAVDEPCIECRDKGMGTYFYRMSAYGQGASGQIGVALQEVKPIVFK